MPCESCTKFKETEVWNIPWFDQQVSGPDAFRKLAYIGNKNDFQFYQCPTCGQAYLYVSWNELFPGGWTEFSKLRKLTATELNSYLPVNKPGK